MAPPLEYPKRKSFQLQGALTPADQGLCMPLDQGLCPWPRWGLRPRPSGGPRPPSVPPAPNLPLHHW